MFTSNISTMVWYLIPGNLEEEERQNPVFRPNAGGVAIASLKMDKELRVATLVFAGATVVTAKYAFDNVSVVAGGVSIVSAFVTFCSLLTVDARCQAHRFN